jgi:hypothetical protein
MGSVLQLLNEYITENSILSPLFFGIFVHLQFQSKIMDFLSLSFDRKEREVFIIANIILEIHNPHPECFLLVFFVTLVSLFLDFISFSREQQVLHKLCNSFFKATFSLWLKNVSHLLDQWNH